MTGGTTIVSAGDNTNSSSQMLMGSLNGVPMQAVQTVIKHTPCTHYMHYTVRRGIEH